MVLNKIDRRKVRNSISEVLVTESFQEIYAFFKFLDDEGRIYKIINNRSTDSLVNLAEAVNFYNYFNLVIDEKAKPLKALLMLFVIEGAISGGEYLDFYSWLVKNGKLSSLINKSQNELNQIMESCHRDYKEDYGTRKKFMRLFNNYLKSDEKIGLLRLFSVHEDSDNSDTHFCYKNTGECCDYARCCLSNDKSHMDLSIKKIVDMLYGFRNYFAHGVGIGHFTYTPKYDYYMPYLITTYNGKTLLVSLRYDKFVDLSQKMIARYLIDNKEN